MKRGLRQWVIPAVLLCVWLAAGPAGATVVVGLEDTSGDGYIASWSYNGSSYQQGPNATSSYSASTKDVDAGDADNDGQDEILWTYRTSSSYVQARNWDGVNKSQSQGYVISGWGYTVVGASVGDVSSNSPGNEVVIAYQKSSGSDINVYDYTDGSVTSLSYGGAWNNWGYDIVDIAVGDVTNDGTTNLLVAYLDGSGHNVVYAYDIYYDSGVGKIVTSTLGKMLDWSSASVHCLGIGDADGDGSNEMLFGYDNGGTATLNVYTVNDGQISKDDWVYEDTILTGWNGQITGAGVWVPEPATLCLLTMGGMGVLLRRK